MCRLICFLSALSLFLVVSLYVFSFVFANFLILDGSHKKEAKTEPIWGEDLDRFGFVILLFVLVSFLHPFWSGQLEHVKLPEKPTTCISRENIRT